MVTKNPPQAWLQGWHQTTHLQRLRWHQCKSAEAWPGVFQKFRAKQNQNLVIFNSLISSALLQLLPSDNAYPKEQRGRDACTGRAWPRSWAGKTIELVELFQTPFLEGCISLNGINGGVQAQKARQIKTLGTKQCKGCSQLQCAFRVEQFLQVSNAGLLMV